MTLKRTYVELPGGEEPPKTTARYAARWRRPIAHPANRVFVCAGGAVPGSPDETLNSEIRSDLRHTEAISVVSHAARVGEARVRSAGSVCSERASVVLFLPGPVTEADLLADHIRCARRMRRHKIRRRRTEWLRANIGILVFVIGLFALTWLVADK